MFKSGFVPKNRFVFVVFSVMCVDCIQWWCWIVWPVCWLFTNQFQLSHVCITNLRADTLRLCTLSQLLFIFPGAHHRICVVNFLSTNTDHNQVSSHILAPFIHFMMYILYSHRKECLCEKVSFYSKACRMDGKFYFSLRSAAQHVPSHAPMSSPLCGGSRLCSDAPSDWVFVFLSLHCLKTRWQTVIQALKRRSKRLRRRGLLRTPQLEKITGTMPDTCWQLWVGFH